MRAILLFIFCAILITSCETISVSDRGLERYIPRKAAVVLLTHDVKDLTSTLRNNAFVSEFQATDLYAFIGDQSRLLSSIEPDGKTLFCFTKVGRADYEVSLITELHAGLFKRDSLLGKEANLKDKEIKSLGTDDYYLVYDGAFIASSSKLLLENIIREDPSEEKEDALFARAYSSANLSATATVFVRGSEGGSLFNTVFPASDDNALRDTFSWAAADLDLSANNVSLNGVVLAQDSTSLRLNLLKGTEPVPNRITEMTPLSATEISAVTYRDFENYKESSANFLQMDASKITITGEPLFKTFTEVGLVHLPKGKAIIAVSADMAQTEEALIGSDRSSEYRKVPIFKYGNETAFAKAFKPLLNLPSVKLYAQVDDFFIFGESQEVLETLIANYQNKAVLSQSDIFKNTERQLSSASSFLNIKNLQSGAYKTKLSEKGQKILKDTDLKGYNYAASQLVQEDDYLLYNAVILKNDSGQNATGVSQVANVKLNAAISMAPQLIKNHRTNGMDIVVQDVNNTLYLISNAGKVLWQRDMDEQILGEIQQVDLYRNGRLQLAFATSKSFYILDRNGKNVSPYPLSFKDKITQPLAIFDYDNNRKYRFVIIQNDEVLMYNREAKPVTGFTFTKAAAAVVFPPTHIRMASKDYIVIVDANGKVNILNRTGQSRIDVQKNIEAGDTPIFKDGNSFATYDVNGNKISINTSGKVSERIADFSSDSKIGLDGGVAAGIRENELVVAGKKVKIPFGTYATPRVVTVGKRRYVGVANTEANEIMIYDGNGKALPNFPVYGISRPDIAFLERNKSLGFVTQSDV